MGFLALVNLLALVLLFKVGLKVMPDFDHQIKNDEPQPTFNPKQFPELNLDHQAWALDDPSLPEVVMSSSNPMR